MNLKKSVQLKCCALGVSSQTVNEATLETPRPSNSRVDAADGRQLTDFSPPRPPPRPPPGTSSLRHQQPQQQRSGSLRRGAARGGAIVHDDEDVFIVGPPGGMFQSTTDPDVSIFIPPTSVAHTITLTMQVT